MIASPITHPVGRYSKLYLFNILRNFFFIILPVRHIIYLNMDFVNELRKRGKRITNAREVVCKILETSGHKHFTVEELHKLSLKKDKNIDLATVYRTLELLENINLIEHSHQVHGSGLYFVKDVHSNIHIVCESCGDISDLDIKTSEKVNNLITSNTNFREITNHFVYSGYCKKCK